MNQPITRAQLDADIRTIIGKTLRAHENDVLPGTIVSHDLSAKESQLTTILERVIHRVHECIDPSLNGKPIFSLEQVRARWIDGLLDPLTYRHTHKSLAYAFEHATRQPTLMAAADARWEKTKALTIERLQLIAWTELSKHLNAEAGERSILLPFPPKATGVA